MRQLWTQIALLVTLARLWQPRDTKTPWLSGRAGNVSAIGLWLVGAALLVSGGLANAAEPTPNLLRVRDTICSLEPRGLKRQDAAYRKNKNGSVDLGICQINTDTLRMLGFLSGYDANGKPYNAWRDPKMIFDVEGSRAIALELLERIRVRLEAGHIRVTVFNIAHKYCRFNAAIKKEGVCARAAIAVELAYNEGK